jgi:hypothetical protein
MMGATSLVNVGAALSEALVLFRVAAAPTTARLAMRTPRNRFIYFLLIHGETAF